VDVTAQRDSRDDGMPPDCARIEVRVGEMRQRVALWRPLEILLYDWWPIFGEARLFNRLSAMRAQVVRY
jgi:hypothetical protein